MLHNSNNTRFIEAQKCSRFCKGANVISSSMLLLWFLSLPIAGMAFDAPDSRGEVMPYVIFYGILVYPLLFFISLTCWLPYRTDHIKAAYILASIPGLWYVPVIIMFLFANFYPIFHSIFSG